LYGRESLKMFFHHAYRLPVRPSILLGINLQVIMDIETVIGILRYVLLYALYVLLTLFPIKGKLAYIMQIWDIDDALWRI
ncbi:MAG: hypothetical protein LBB81_04015, partial [Treponema sp.]|nr:hypothetical protein [Treponema sp.]